MSQPPTQPHHHHHHRPPDPSASACLPLPPLPPFPTHTIARSTHYKQHEQFLRGRRRQPASFGQQPATEDGQGGGQDVLGPIQQVSKTTCVCCCVLCVCLLLPAASSAPLFILTLSQPSYLYCNMDAAHPHPPLPPSLPTPTECAPSASRSAFPGTTTLISI